MRKWTRYHNPDAYLLDPEFDDYLIYEHESDVYSNNEDQYSEVNDIYAFPLKHESYSDLEVIILRAHKPIGSLIITYLTNNWIAILNVIINKLTYKGSFKLPCRLAPDEVLDFCAAKDKKLKDIHSTRCQIKYREV